MRAQYKINFDRPPRLKKLPEALIISPELRHPTDRQKDTNRNLDRLYITRPKRLDTSKRSHAILHVKNSVLPSAAITVIFRILKIPAFPIPGFKDSGFSRSVPVRSAF